MYGGALAGFLLLLLTPVLTSGWPLIPTLCFIHLPVYMMHQYEEHDQDRFRQFFNTSIGKGNDVLSPLAVFITNVPGVWGILGLALYGTIWSNPACVLFSSYLILVNAFVHIVHAVLFKRYNPGLATAIALFIPLGLFTIFTLSELEQGNVRQHLLALISAIGIHAAILLHVKRKLKLHLAQ
jgi:hypothetical protein